jgi:hypothetical protein
VIAEAAAPCVSVMWAVSTLLSFVVGFFLGRWSRDRNGAA